MHKRQWGVRLVNDTVARARLWAPDMERIRLQINSRTLEMEKDPEGWFEIEVDQIAAGDSYSFILPDGSSVPDPASQRQVDTVDGPSQLVDHKTFHWKNDHWRGRPWHEAIFYELHVGTFTQEGTVAAAAEKLDHIAGLGFTAIELMPIAAFEGMRGWGYDGILNYAPLPAYGSPDDLKSLIDRAHGAGLMVFLDVVYNHLGLFGNTIERYAPQFFHADGTPWGPAPDFGREETRSYFIDNALYWLTEFRLDGLRFDASDRLAADGKDWLVDEIADLARDRIRDRTIHLVVEDARNVPAPMEDRQGRPPSCRAAWNDDLHHAIHVLTTGEAGGHYEDFAVDPLTGIRTALAEGFIYQGQSRSSKGGEPSGKPSSHLPPTCFVNFLQNHDQIGNRLKGDRLSTLIDADIFKALTAMLYLSPQIPLTFMGEEFKAQTPFLFFSDHAAEDRVKALKGRLSEARNFGATRADDLASVPDPNALDTLRASKLDWKNATSDEGLWWRDFTRELLELRRRRIWPLIADPLPFSGRILPAEDGVIAVDWQLGRHRLELRCNLGKRDAMVPDMTGELFYRLGSEHGETSWPPGAIAFASDHPEG